MWAECLFMPTPLPVFFVTESEKDNVIFVSSTDCYGSPALEGYRKLAEAGFTGTIEDYVGKNHQHQKATLKDYEIEPNLFAASGIGPAKEMHRKVSAEFFNKLYQNSDIVKDSTPQFFDPEAGIFLNGRQVVGRCPFDGCGSDHGYADELFLRTPVFPQRAYRPEIHPSGKTPELRAVTNWYFKLDSYLDVMTAINEDWKKNSNLRNKYAPLHR